MITSSITPIFIGSFFLYSASEKAQLTSNFALYKWMQHRASISKIIGLVLLIISLIVTIQTFGLVSGVLFWFITLMISLSSIIIMTPLQVVNYKLITVAFLTMLIIEILL